MLEKSIEKQTELAIADDVPDQRAKVGVVKDQRWVYATLDSTMDKLNPAVQCPSQDQLESLSSQEIEQFTITGVLLYDHG